MTEPVKSALLVIDVQNHVVREAVRRDAVIATIHDLVQRARDAGTPVVWIQHSHEEMPIGSEGWQIVEGLLPAEGEPRVRKEYGDSFEETDLSEVLTSLDVGRLVLTGAQTDACVRCTLHGALARGYDTTLVADGHTTMDMRPWGSPIGPEQAIDYANLYWRFTTAPGRSTEVLPSADLVF